MFIVNKQKKDPTIYVVYYFERYFSAIFSIRDRIIGGGGSKPTRNKVFQLFSDRAIIEFSVV